MARFRVEGRRRPDFSLDLPARGITGNSHFPMMDGNSDQVARLVEDWLRTVPLAPARRG